MNNAQLFSSAALPGPLPYSAAKSGSQYAFFGLPTSAAAAAVAPVANQVVYTPIFVPFPITVSKLGVITGGSANTLYFALYSLAAGGGPGALIYDFGVGGNSVPYGMSATAASSPPTLQRGWYILAVVSSGTTPSILGYAPASAPAAAFSGLMGVYSFAQSTTVAPSLLNAATLTAGAFPSTPVAPSTSAAIMHIAQMLAA